MELTETVVFGDDNEMILVETMDEVRDKLPGALVFVEVLIKSYMWPNGGCGASSELKCLNILGYRETTESIKEKKLVSISPSRLGFQKAKAARELKKKQRLESDDCVEIKVEKDTSAVSSDEMTSPDNSPSKKPPVNKVKGKKREVDNLSAHKKDSLSAIKKRKT
jgi:hypothetical protein